MAAKQTGSRSRLVQRVSAALDHSENVMFQKTPYLPDLLHQPNFLMVPHLGRLVAVYVLTPTRPITWHNALASVEDLFELKTSCGEATVAIALLLSDAPQADSGHQALQVLSRYFDGFAIINEANTAHLHTILSPLIRTSVAREELFALWQSERRRTTKNLADFSEERYLPFIETVKQRGSTKIEILKTVRTFLEEETNLGVSRKYSVRSPKEALVGLPERNRFTFDLGVEFKPSGHIVPVEITSLDRYGSREKLRYLMTKARLTSYESDGGRLIPRYEDLRPVLVVSGNLAGPTHDPYRYVRALVSVGWRLVNTSTDSVRKEVYADL